MKCEVFTFFFLSRLLEMLSKSLVHKNKKDFRTVFDVLHDIMSVGAYSRQALKTNGTNPLKFQ